mmetsp:Transcript_116135/g.329135  ORF Transcript_116135/g.329135 Transcript_116135/m.329135 type:complete len:517 (-) Transcript_116135:424-1974(-)
MLGWGACPRLACAPAPSVDLDRPVDRPDEVEGGAEADRPCEEGEGGRHREHIAKIEQGPYVMVHLQPRDKVEDGVEEDVQRRRCTSEERTPPPVVVLVGELEVRQCDGNLRAGDDEDQDHEHQETEKVVELVLPEGGHDEEELREDGAERQDPPHERGEDPPDVPGLRRDLPRDLVRAHRQGDRLLLVAEEGPEEDEGHRDAEPEHQEREHRGEGHRPGGLLPPDQEVQDEEDGEDEARVEHRRHEGHQRPALAAEELVEARLHVAREDAHEGEEEHHGLQQAAPVRRREEAQEREDQGHDGHPEDLHAGAHGGEQEPRVGRPPEDVPVHELPARLLGRLLRGGELVVPRDVAVQRAQEDHGHHAGEEEHDQEGVQDGEPVDLPARHLEVVVPAGGPAVRALGPLHVVRVGDLVVHVEVEEGARGAVLAHLGGPPVALGARLRDAVGLHLEPDDPVPLVLVGARVVLQVQLDVVVHVVPAVPLEADGEAVHVHELVAVGLPDIARRCGQVVDDPVH